MHHSNSADEKRRNPYPIYAHPVLNEVRDNPIVGWRWFDEAGLDHEKVYASQSAALKDLLAYAHFLDHGPTLWQRVWWPARYWLLPLIQRFWRDEGHPQ